MKTRELLTFGIIFFLTLSINAQSTIDWQTCIGGSEYDIGGEIQETSDGGYIVAASSRSSNGDVSSNQGGYDFWIVKLFSNGAIDWEESFGGSSIDQAESVQQTSDGGYIVAGSTYSNNGDVTDHHGSLDCWVVKLSSSGALQWQKTLGGSLDEMMKSVRQTTDGGYILIGYSDSNDGDVSANHGGRDMWIVKLTSTGTISWEKSLGGSGYDDGSSIQETSDGGFIVGGSASSNDGDVTENFGQFDFWAIKLSVAGEIIWEKSFGGSGSDRLASIQQTKDGGYILGGQTVSIDGDVTSDKGSTDFWIVKLTSSGTLDWEKSLGGTDHDTQARVHQTRDGGYIISGNTRSNNGDVTVNNGYVDIWLVKLSCHGVIRWQKSIGGSLNDYFPFGGGTHGIKQVSDGGFIVLGNSDSVNGDVTNNNGLVDCWIVKLPTFINEVDPQQLNVFPNPTIDRLNFELSNGQIGTNYTIHDYAGRIVSAGEVQEHCGCIDAGHLSPGAYSLQVSTNEDNLISPFVKM